MLPYLHQFSAVMPALFWFYLGQIFVSLWCKSSCIIKIFMPELKLLFVVFRTNLMSNISIKALKSTISNIRKHFFYANKCRFNSHFNWVFSNIYTLDQ